MRARNKYRRPTTLHCNAGTGLWLSTLLLGLVTFVIVLQLYSVLRRSSISDEEIQLPIHESLYLQELIKVEEEELKIPPPRKRSARAMKRKPKKPMTVLEEFLDETSQIRHLFFPDMKTAIDPLREVGNESHYYYPGRIWLDTDGKPIQAHGGGILNDKRSNTYYWYGEYKDGPTYHAHKKGSARVSSIIILISFQN